MALFDSDFVEARVGSMKMTQNSLQQLMTLSAGGLALYFSFISHAEFLESLRFIGILVVWCWISALVTAAIGHKLLGEMVIHLNRFSTSFSDATAEPKQPKEADSEIIKSINPDAIHEAINKNRKEVKSEFDKAVKKFEDDFFPTQDRVLALVDWSLASMVIGFVVIGIGYSIWALNTS
ncbi:MAG: hypothetical protein KAT90_04665 [Gammaproteobacteria bacterium]|nr:hypothetical protein [Gammaproteobacteria bacterium]